MKGVGSGRWGREKAFLTLGGSEDYHPNPTADRALTQVASRQSGVCRLSKKLGATELP